jgi:hypothetical protein
MSMVCLQSIRNSFYNLEVYKLLQQLDSGWVCSVIVVCEKTVCEKVVNLFCNTQLVISSVKCKHCTKRKVSEILKVSIFVSSFCA